MAIFYEKGRYQCEVIGQGLGKSEQKGTPFFYITFTVLKYIVGPDQYEDVTRSFERTMKKYLTDKTMDFAIDDMLTLGFEVDSPTQIDLEHPKAFSIVGNMVEMYCGHKTNEKGQEFEDWNVGRKSGSFKATPIDRSEAKGLEAMFGASLKTKRKMAESERPKVASLPVSKTALEALDEDDPVPF